MQPWCLAVLCLCFTAILAGMLWLGRARGVQIVSGRTAAKLAYVKLFAATVLSSTIVCLAVRMYPIVSSTVDLSQAVLPMAVATGALVTAGLVCLTRGARSLGRSVIFHNIHRDELAAAVAATLRELRMAASHRLRMFRDDFVLPSGRLVVHGAVHMSRLEWIGPDENARNQILEATIQRLKDALQAEGRDVVDGRGLSDTSASLRDGT